MHKYILQENRRFKELSVLLEKEGFHEEDQRQGYGAIAMFVDFDYKTISYSGSVTCAAAYCSGRYNPIEAGFIIDNFDEIVNKKNFKLLDEKYFRKK